MFVVVVVLKLHLKFPSRGGKGGGRRKNGKEEKKVYFSLYFFSSPQARIRSPVRSHSLSISISFLTPTLSTSPAYHSYCTPIHLAHHIHCFVPTNVLPNRSANVASARGSAGIGMTSRTLSSNPLTTW